MKFLLVLFTLTFLTSAFAAEPLRVFIRAGQKSHAPGAHDFPQFLKDWVPMLNERGAKADGSLEFPTKEQLDKTDVLILHAQEAGNIQIGEQRKNLMEFLARGGGLVVIHAAAVSRDHDWFKTIIGGSWHFGRTKWLEAPMSLYFTDRENPITRDISNFDIDDEIYYDMDMLPEVNVLAAAYTPNAIDTGGKGNKEAQQRAAEAVAKGKAVNIYDIQPQMWTYERRAGILPATGQPGILPGSDNSGRMPETPESGRMPDLPTYRAFVCIPGHWYKNFSHTGLRTAILRGIAWAGKRENVDELCKPDEVGDAVRYVEGGVPRPQDIPKHLEVHPEFDISLVASEPLINNPMNIDWDEKGRLWVVETPEYPNGLRQANVETWKDSGSLKPGQYDRDPQDRVSILEDTDGDGIMDKKTVFADKIELATSSVFYKNGIIVCAAPDIWFFEDTDGDDKADKRTKLYTNLGTRDTHAVINNMRWGLDGWVYATHGYSSSDNVQALGSTGVPPVGVEGVPPSSNPTAGGTPATPTAGTAVLPGVSIGAGVVRFKPDGTAIEQYASRGGNTWGLDITWDGQVFYTQPTSGNHFVHVVLPEYVLAKGKLPGVVGTNGMLPREPTYPAMQFEQQAYVQIDQVGSYTAAAGCAIYEGGAWPNKWNYSYFTTEPTLNIVSHFMVEPDGVTYKAKREPGREQTEFIRSTNLWFRPIEVRVGPDGALYVVDFCNQAIIHNDTRGPTHGPANAAVRPDRDHYYGRIWKVQHKEAKKLEVVEMEKDNPTQLLTLMRYGPNAKTNQTAFRLAVENHNASGLASAEKRRSRLESIARLSNTDPAALSTLTDPVSVDDLAAGQQILALRDSLYPVGKSPAGFHFSDLHRLFAVVGYPTADTSLTDYSPFFTKVWPKVKGSITEKNLPIDVRGMLLGLNKTHFFSRAVTPVRTPMWYWMIRPHYHNPEIRKIVLSGFTIHDDEWSKSAIIASASDHAVDFICDSLLHQFADQLDQFVQALLPSALPLGVSRLVDASANPDSKADALKIAILRGIAQQSNEAPALTPTLTEALKKLLAQPALAAATLPLVTKWDKGGVLADEVKTQLDKLSTTLTDDAAPVEARINAARALIAVGGDGSTFGAPALAGTDAPEALQSAIIAALDEHGAAHQLVPAMSRLKAGLQTQAFEAILKRPEAVNALLTAVQDGKVDRAIFAPGDVARLRSHPNKPIARRANELFQINNAAKDAIIAKLVPEVEKPGNAVNGKMLFTAACAVCHKLGDIGFAVGPPLDGMGAHGPAELLIHIIDPNREVDPSFWAFNITTKKGEVLQGVVTSENATTVMLATQVGLREIAKTDIDKRENTRRSLMPEGLDALGPEPLRDILAYMCGDAMKQFRILHLAGAFTADSREGIFAGPAPNQGRVKLAKFGNVKIENIPFFIQDPARSSAGANMIVLKGGPNPNNHSQTFPAKVEVPIGVETKRLQLLSGIAGWGFPAVKDEVTTLKATVVYASGETEDFTFLNGVHFADYVRPIEVAGSKYVEGLTEGQQMRLLTLELTKKGIAKTLILESPEGNRTVPVIVAITADIEGRAGFQPATSGRGILPGSNNAGRMPATPESGGTPDLQAEGRAGFQPAASGPGILPGSNNAGRMPATPESGGTPDLQPKAGGRGDAPLPPALSVSWEPGKTKVLLIGGGSAHDFPRFFGDTDSATLKAAGFTVHYTEDRDQAAAELANADVAVISVNRKFFDTPAYRKALMDFAAAGKGIVMLHPGTWYGYAQWPELNAQIVGGGARGHDKIHPFEVKTVKRHPVMEGVPAAFTVEDELYYINAEPDKIPEGTAAIEVLAETSPSDKFQKPHPSIWITNHPSARIVGIALGHDERVHDHDAFKKVLANAVKWAARK